MTTKRRMERHERASAVLLTSILAGCGGGGSPSSPAAPQTPVPSITSLSPTSEVACGTALTLVVNGADFLSGSTVQWNGASRTTSYVGATQLKAAITAADVAVPGTASVTVVNSPGGPSSTGASFFVDCTNQVQIDGQSPALATIDKDVFGVNLSGSMDLTSGNGNYTTIMSTFRNANFGMVRWPFAAFSDYYHWQTNSFSVCAAASTGRVAPIVNRDVDV